LAEAHAALHLLSEILNRRVSGSSQLSREKEETNCQTHSLLRSAKKNYDVIISFVCLKERLGVMRHRCSGESMVCARERCVERESVCGEMEKGRVEKRERGTVSVVCSLSADLCRCVSVDHNNNNNVR
jgi:hypothetical protein